MGALRVFLGRPRRPRKPARRGRSPKRRPKSRQVDDDGWAEAERWLGSRNMTGKGGPWCAHFASYVLQRTGHRPLATGRRRPRSATAAGLREPKVGALAVVTTRVGYAAHVGFVA